MFTLLASIAFLSILCFEIMSFSLHTLPENAWLDFIQSLNSLLILPQTPLAYNRLAPIKGTG